MPNPIHTDYYLFVLLSGLRRRSAAVIRWEHVDLEARTLFIPEPKGGKKRAFNHALSNDITGNYIRAGESLRRSQQRVTDWRVLR